MPARPAGHGVAASPTVPARTTWQHGAGTLPVSALPERRGLLNRMTPAHVAIMLVCATLLLVMGSMGPGALDVPSPPRLPAITGGGTLPLEPGTAGTRRVAIGSSSVPVDVRAGGIPSPAAGRHLAGDGQQAAGGGSPGTRPMDGIPSFATGRALGPTVLPLEPDDGVTLARTAGERDSWGVDEHYGHGSGDVLALESEAALPALTPGAAAERAELEAARRSVQPDDTAWALPRAGVSPGVGGNAAS